MALTCLRTRAFPSSTVRPQRRLRLAVRAQVAIVTFKVHRHVEYGQSVLLVGNSPELGAWDTKNALPLAWGDGDHWSSKVNLASGTSVEYKYIVKRKDGYDWCPGQNKAVTLPAATAVEISDSWEARPGSVTVTAAAAPAIASTAPAVAASEPAATAAVTPAAPEASEPAAPAPQAAAAPETAALAPAAEAAAAAAAAATVLMETVFPAGPYGGASGRDEDGDRLPLPAAPGDASPISTVENVRLEGEEEPCPASASNNIVQAPAAVGAVAAAPVGPVSPTASADPITAYEEADKMEVLEVGSGGRLTVAAATSTEAPAAAGPATTAAASPAAAAKPGRAANKTTTRKVDSLTVSELKSELKRRGMSALGNRRELITRLQKAQAL